MLCLCLKCLLGLKDGTDSSGNVVAGGYEQSHGCWESDLGPGEEPVLLTAELPFQMQEVNFVNFKEKYDGPLKFPVCFKII